MFFAHSSTIIQLIMPTQVLPNFDFCLSLLLFRWCLLYQKSKIYLVNEKRKNDFLKEEIKWIIEQKFFEIEEKNLRDYSNFFLFAKHQMQIWSRLIQKIKQDDKSKKVT